MTWSHSLAVATTILLLSCSSSTTVRGVVTAVEGDLTSVHSFTVRTDSGRTLQISPAPDGAFEFELIHLRDHLRSSEPIAVTYVVRNGLAVAVAISDG